MPAQTSEQLEQIWKDHESWTNTEMTSYRAVQQRVQISAVNTKNPDWSIMMQNSNMPSSVKKVWKNVNSLRVESDRKSVV